MKAILLYIDQDAKIQHSENVDFLCGDADCGGLSIDSLLSPTFKTVSFMRILDEMKRGLTQYKTVIWEVLKRDTNTTLMVQLAVSLVEENVYLVVINEYKAEEFSITLGSNGNVKSCGSQSMEFFGLESKAIQENGLSLLFGLNEEEIKSILATEQDRSLVGKHGSGVDFSCNVNVKKKKFGSTSIAILNVLKVNPKLDVSFVLDPEGNVESFSSIIFESVFGFKVEMVGKPLQSLLNIEAGSSSCEEGSDEAYNMDHKSKRRKLIEHECLESFAWQGDGEHIIKYYNGLLKHIDGSNLAIQVEFYSKTEKTGEKKSVVKVNRVLMKTSRYYGKWELAERLGNGSGGKVIAARHKESGKPAAIKVIKKRSLEEEEFFGRIKKESEIMMQLDHPNIIKLYEVLETKSELMIVMELVEGGTDLLKFLKKKEKFSEKDARVVFNQILDAIGYCHSKQIFHRDIKHENLLVSTEETIKVIDFGLSRVIEKGSLGTTFCGTPQYSAPEMILGKEYDGSSIDIWSLGIVFYSLVTEGEFPYEGINDILTKKLLTFPESLSEDCKDLIQRMLERESKKRITVPDIISHPWFKRLEEAT
eukprot:TRINITY_DN6754_c0_g1_i1.p1 TRINITY_DN6754_c0_g1~~TRINITY_DN6754_c0_g1_i1.p1  ORF type:complete len:591 (+),score=192.21 TRINITY_DN6754_c0_g1_i1:86-1858(+)